MIEYNPHDWRSHLLDIKGSMLREIIGRVLTCVIWSAAVVGFHQFLSPRIAIPSTVHSLIGTALGLLLVFRTNASYDRFWEGRRLWGSIINDARDLGRGACAHLAGDPARRDAIICWTIAFAYASMNSLRGATGLGPMADRLPAGEVRAVLATVNVPETIALRISEHLVGARDEGRISDFLLVDLEENVQLLTDHLGGCERIHKTPLPFPYMVHLRRALFLFCFTLPFALVKDFGWGTILDTLLVSYILFGIEEIGVEIEDPFGPDENDLPLERLCGTIERDLLAMMQIRGRGFSELAGAGLPPGSPSPMSQG
jgi:ion channel-forming bestrophin family protein